MSAIPGQDAKGKGNAAFKSEDFPAAVGHYTAAILADPNNPTYCLNRAAAYLRLGKNEDAERDCEATIKLDQKNVKAWFRRGQARAGQDKLEGARDDFKRTLQLDPVNGAAKQELAKVEALLQYRSANAGKKRTPIDVSAPSSSKSTPVPNASSSSVNDAAPKRRRVPIKIVDTVAPASASTLSPASTKPQAKAALEPNKPSTSTASSISDDFMKPVSTRSLIPSTSSAVNPAPAPTASKSTSFKDLKQAREASKASTSSTPSPTPGASTSSPPSSPPSAASQPRVGTGGGIFRSNGQHTVFGLSTRGMSVPKSESLAAPKPAPTVNGQGPMTLFVFNRTWAAVDSPVGKWSFLVDNTPPGSLPAMFKTSLEAPQLISMLETFKFVLSEYDGDSSAKDRVKAYLLNLARVPRFSTIMMFMSKNEKTLVKEVWGGVSRTDDQIEAGARKVWGVL